MPAVVVATEQFEKLAKVIIRSQNVPESICVMVQGNPEFISAEKLEVLCEQVAEAVLQRLTRAHSQ
ncbi:MAG: hypothetical protein FJY56_17185 [Betaproteobacteria bacterium]|nr:hypothetical protein [Betaproteobacteria bacterium]